MSSEVITMTSVAWTYQLSSTQVARRLSRGEQFLGRLFVFSFSLSLVFSSTLHTHRHTQALRKPPAVRIEAKPTANHERNLSDAIDVLSFFYLSALMPKQSLGDAVVKTVWRKKTENTFDQWQIVVYWRHSIGLRRWQARDNHRWHLSNIVNSIHHKQAREKRRLSFVGHRHSCKDREREREREQSDTQIIIEKASASFIRFADSAALNILELLSFDDF